MIRTLVILAFIGLVLISFNSEIRCQLGNRNACNTLGQNIGPHPVPQSR